MTFNDRFMTPTSDCSERQDVDVKIKHVHVLQIHHASKKENKKHVIRWPKTGEINRPDKHEINHNAAFY